MVEESTTGIPVAAPPGMVRRIAAMIGMLVVVALALGLMWRVYLHHEDSHAPADAPTLVALPPEQT